MSIGDQLIEQTLLTSNHHLPRGDDAIAYDKGAAWVTGDSELRRLYVHRVDAKLNYKMATVK
jgi:hypothetical protein